ncbi:unnamed protein product [Phytomonas sp. EM1]|nr:unnamed protein product [Phytomonas sp. EM1]|eukprot:CCW62444.1 unnamed protein product [Phytomonas sp. isolate EM1]
MLRSQELKPQEALNTSTPSGVEVVIPSSSLQLPYISDECADYKTRYNTSQVALGKIKRRKICGITFYFSPDCCLFCVPTVITLLLAGANIFILWSDINILELSVVVVLLFIAFLTSFLLTCTEPGVYPRLNPGEEDPLGKDSSLVYCRVCGLRRPPRTSHCYVCGVCVLEHDHHCKIIGGCVGIRSLRWFVIYLLSVASASSIGLFWSIRFLFCNVIFPDAASEFPLSALTLKCEAQKNNITGTNSNADSARSDMYDIHVGAVFLLAFNIAMVMTLGSMSLLYLLLVCSSKTRREIRRKSSTGTARRRFRFCENLMHTIFPPPSMLEYSKLRISDRTPLNLV